MDRYKQAKIINKNTRRIYDCEMWNNPNGEWVKYSDVISIINELSLESDIEGIDWVTVQIDRETWNQIKKLMEGRDV